MQQRLSQYMKWLKKTAIIKVDSIRKNRNALILEFTYYLDVHLSRTKAYVEDKVIQLLVFE